ncbi:MAG: hypothetical protein AAF438_01230 [Pseudomonadota bacterium]
MTIDSWIHTFLYEHELPSEFLHTASRFYVPLGDWVHRHLSHCDNIPFLLGVNGAQGTGKSTLAEFLRRYLQTKYGVRSLVLSIDDLYLTKKERQLLSQQIHPLLAVRGAPGTHDIDLGCHVLNQLRSLSTERPVLVPRFDKSTDDRYPNSEWTIVDDLVDLIIFEGWCVGSQAVADEALQDPVNELERTKDTDGVWRRYVNQQLQEKYPALFSQLNALVFLAAPNFDCVYRWRLEQEQKLPLSDSTNSRRMSESEIALFIQYFERVTRQNLAQLPISSDVHLTLDVDHQVTNASYNT